MILKRLSASGRVSMPASVWRTGFAWSGVVCWPAPSPPARRTSTLRSVALAATSIATSLRVMLMVTDLPAIATHTWSCWMADVNPSQSVEFASTRKVVQRGRVTPGSSTPAPSVAALTQLCRAPSLPAHQSHVDLAPRLKLWVTRRVNVALVKFAFPQWASAPLQWPQTVASSSRQSR